MKLSAKEYEQLMETVVARQTIVGLDGNPREMEWRGGVYETDDSPRLRRHHWVLIALNIVAWLGLVGVLTWA